MFLVLIPYFLSSKLNNEKREKKEKNHKIGHYTCTKRNDFDIFPTCLFHYVTPMTESSVNTDRILGG